MGERVSSRNPFCPVPKPGDTVRVTVVKKVDQYGFYPYKGVEDDDGVTVELIERAPQFRAGDVLANFSTGRWVRDPDGHWRPVHRGAGVRLTDSDAQERLGRDSNWRIVGNIYDLNKREAPF